MAAEFDPLSRVVTVTHNTGEVLVRMSLTPMEVEVIQELCKARNRITPIKWVREKFGLGLRNAKFFIDAVSPWKD